MHENDVNLYNEFNENTHKDLLKDKTCDICSSPATQWYGRTSRILCNDARCRKVCEYESAELVRDYKNSEDDY